MTTRQDLTFHQGEPWRIKFAAKDADGDPIPLESGVEVEFRVSDWNGPLMTLTVGDGINITDVAGGLADITVSLEAQEAVHIDSGNMYAYEIHVTTNEFVSVQSEGMLLVSSSLFYETDNPTLRNFKLRFPEFTENDTILNLYINDATSIVDETDEWPADRRTAAIVLLAAHFVKMRKDAYDQYSSSVATGAVRAIRIEDRSVIYDTSTQGMSTRIGLMATMYGQQYLSLSRHNTRFLMRG